MVFLAQVFTIGQLSHDFAHGLALELQAVSVVHEAVQDGVCQGIVADAGVPVWCKYSNEPYDIVIRQYYG